MVSEPVILVLNSGSSSIKFSLFQGEQELVSGQISGIGDTSRIQLKSRMSGRILDRLLDRHASTHHTNALNELLPILISETNDITIDAVGHRVVHGGIDYAMPTRIDDGVIADLERLIPLAPLHQPHNLAGIRASRTSFPNAAQVACFDTAFHRHHPWVSDTFALPRSYYEGGLRRYGFHGLSYEYICEHLKDHYPDIYPGRVVVAHLGNGASMCGIQNGQSIGSTMGFSALDGLPMGTRCGDVDPGVVLYLMKEKGLNADEISDLLYNESGLKGLSGISHDMRTLVESSDPAATDAVNYFVFRAQRELGSMSAVLHGIDAFVFTGGIGENSPLIRSKICKDQDWLDLRLDDQRNENGQAIISADSSRVNVLMIPANEEEMIRRHTVDLI